MELVWLVISLIVVDLAALLWGVDTRPGLQHSGRRRDPRRAAAVPPAVRLP